MDNNVVEVDYLDGEAYEIEVRGHRIKVDQPHDAGGADTAPTATELFVASLASCVASNAGWYLVMHGYDRLGLNVTAAFDLATDRPAGVRAISISVNVPNELPTSRRRALQAVLQHCSVHHAVNNPPEIQIDLT